MSPPGHKIPAHQFRKEQELPEDQHTHFRALAARVNFLAADRPDGLMFAVRRIRRFKSKPIDIAWRVLDRRQPHHQGMVVHTGERGIEQR